MKTLKNFFLSFVQPWQHNYLESADNLEDLERRLTHLEKFEQHQALLFLHIQPVKL